MAPFKPSGFCWSPLFPSDPWVPQFLLGYLHGFLSLIPYPEVQLTHFILWCLLWLSIVCDPSVHGFHHLLPCHWPWRIVYTFPNYLVHPIDGSNISLPSQTPSFPFTKGSRSFLTPAFVKLKKDALVHHLLTQPKDAFRTLTHETFQGHCSALPSSFKPLHSHESSCLLLVPWPFKVCIQLPLVLAQLRPSLHQQTQHVKPCTQVATAITKIYTFINWMYKQDQASIWFHPLIDSVPTISCPSLWVSFFPWSCSTSQSIPQASCLWLLPLLVGCIPFLTQYPFEWVITPSLFTRLRLPFIMLPSSLHSDSSVLLSDTLSSVTDWSLP